MRTDYVKLLAIACAGLLAAGCGGSDDPDGGGLRVALTDAPVDTATAVQIQFSGIEIKPAGGEAFRVGDFDPPKTIDLLTLQDGTSEVLVDVDLAAGQYSWIRLMVNTSRDQDSPSRIVFPDDDYPLWIPSGNESGLKLVTGFIVPIGGVADFTIDFDLRKSIHKPGAQDGIYYLRPALRLVDNALAGFITGKVDASLLTFDGGDDTCAVYVFAGAGTAPDDIDGDEGDPLTTATVHLSDSDGLYHYRAAFLPEGPYTLALTCDATADDPGVDDDETVVGFPEIRDAEVTAGEHSVVDFEPAPAG